MRWMLVFIAVLAAIAIGVVVAGMSLPQNHVATRTTHLSAPPETVWGLISNAPDFPSWRSNVDSVEVLKSGNAPSWREVSKGERMTYEAVVFQPPAHMVTRITDKGLPFGGSWDYQVSPDGTTGTRLTITENGEVYNPIFRFVSKFIMGHTATIDRYLTDLSKKTDDTYKPVTD
jgi:uncharacterized membrane protein